MEKHVIVPCIVYNKELIPIWDDRIEFNECEDYGKYITIKDVNEEFFNFTNCIYDLKSKTLSAGITIDVYPKKRKFRV